MTVMLQNEYLQIDDTSSNKSRETANEFQYIPFPANVPNYSNALHYSTEFLEPSRASTMELFGENNQRLLAAIFAKKLHRRCSTWF